MTLLHIMTFVGGTGIAKKRHNGTVWCSLLSASARTYSLRGYCHTPTMADCSTLQACRNHAVSQLNWCHHISNCVYSNKAYLPQLLLKCCNRPPVYLHPKGCLWLGCLNTYLQNSTRAFLTISGLVMTLTFDLLTSNQFIFVPNCT